MTPNDISERVEAIRRFNRFYTKQIGVVTTQYLKTPFTLAVARVIYELAYGEQATATQIVKELDLDAGYLSRILRDLEKQGLITKQPSATDGRQSVLNLTVKGQEAFAMLNARSHNGIEAMIDHLPAEDQNRLVEAMRTIERLLGAPPVQKVAYILRPPQPGDMGWVVHRHGVLYAEEYGWDETFEALVAEIVAHFIKNYDPKCERCWIAEKDGENIGSVFLVKKDDTTAKLRLMLVEPKARGLGIGSRLVEECIRFARQAGYTRIVLWTNSVLTAARHMYAKAGFQLIEDEAHHSFGKDLMGETWEKNL
jgi:DNA-binding MarR family transcriptional regulator/N-acetylglutamate synthase-like GNAT family acetyltransferase